MNDSPFTKLFQIKHLPFRIKIIEQMRNLITAGSDFSLLGASGIGKSTLINDLLNEMDISFIIKINCISNSSKGLILTTLANGLSDYFKKSNLKDIVKFNTLYSSLKNSFCKEIDEKIVILFDNIEKLDIDYSFFVDFFKIKTILPFQLSVIFVGVSFKNDIFAKSYQLSLIPMLYLSLPDENFLLHVIKSSIKGENSQITSFLNIFIHNFIDLVQNIDILVNLALMLLPFSSDKLQYNKRQAILMENPGLNESELEKKLQENEGKQYIMMPSIKTDLFVDKIAFFPAILIIASYFGTHNPEKSDKYLFKNYKKANKRSTKAFLKGDTQKNVGFIRLIALSQSLMSLNSKNLKEIDFFDQSLDFYSQLNNLVEEGYITRISQQTGDFEINKTKFICNVEKGVVERICEKLEIKFEEFCCLNS